MKKFKHFLINIYVKCSSAADIFLQQLQTEHHIKKLDQLLLNLQRKTKTKIKPEQKKCMWVKIHFIVEDKILQMEIIL